MSLINDQVRALRDVAQAYSNNGLEKILNAAADTIEELSEKLAAANMERSNAFYNAGWIPVTERPPEDDNFVLMSFENFTLPMIGRYEQQEDGSGGWYLGDCDDEDTCLEHDLFVNAWMKLPERYKED